MSILKEQFPNSSRKQIFDELQEKALRFFQSDWTDLSKLKLHLKGTEFQLKVWDALLKIPFGGVSTYLNIAEQINNKNASRAVEQQFLKIQLHT